MADPYFGVNSLRTNNQNDPLNQVISSNLGTNTNALYTTDQATADIAKRDITNPAYNPSLTSGTTTEKGLFDSFNYGGANGSTGLGGAISAGLGVGQLGLGIMQYLDSSKTNELNRDLLNQQIANNRDTMDTRLARRAQIQKDWGPQTTTPAAPTAPTAPQGLWNYTPKVG